LDWRNDGGRRNRRIAETFDDSLVSADMPPE
jgi:hypothetical protein